MSNPSPRSSRGRGIFLRAPTAKRRFSLKARAGTDRFRDTDAVNCALWPLSSDGGADIVGDGTGSRTPLWKGRGRTDQVRHRLSTANLVAGVNLSWGTRLCTGRHWLALDVSR